MFKDRFKILIHRLNLVACIAAGLACLGTAPAHAVQDPAPLPDQVTQHIVQRWHGAARTTPASALTRHLTEIDTLADGMERALRGAGLTPQNVAAAAMQLEAKRAELQAVHTEVGDRFTALRSRIDTTADPARQARWTGLEQQVEQRFTRLDAALATLARAQTAGQRYAALRQLRALVRQLTPAMPDFGDTAVPTFSAREPGPPRTLPPSDATPAYLASAGDLPETGSDWLRDIVLILVPEAQAAAPVTPPEAASCGYTAADLADDGLDVQLSQEIQDLAASLDYSPARILEYVSNSIRFEPYYGALKGAKGTLYSAAGGATDQASLLIALLRASNIPARYVQGVIDVNEAAPLGPDGRAARWFGAKNSQAAAAIISQGENPVSITFTGDLGVRMAHVWVEACVPYVNYRGMAGDNSGHRWLPLDPSFKDRTYQAGILAGISFDYATFLSTRSNTLPHEAYATQVEAAVRLIDPNNTLADVPYSGTIVPVTFDVLPATLPYEVNSFTSWSNSGTPETPVLPDTHRYRFDISVNGGDAAASLLYPDSIHDRLTLAFKGATPGDQAALDAWIADGNPNSAVPCGISVVPALRREGIAAAAGSVPVDICTTSNQLGLTISLQEGRSWPAPVTSTSFSNIAAANYYAVQGYAFQVSDRLLTERVARLTASVNSTPDPNTNLEEIEGEFLHIVGLKYVRHISEANRRIGALNGESGESGHHMGVTGTQTKVQYLFDVPYAVQRAGLLIDQPGGRSRSVDLTTGSITFSTFLLNGYSSSNFESFIWQENAGLDAISTVRGIQFAAESGIEVLVLDSANWFAESPKFTSNANPALNYSAAQVNQIKTSYIDQGYTVTAPRSLFQYDTWLGTVFVAELNNLPSSASASFIISGGYAGGYSIFNPPPGTDYDFLDFTMGNIDGVTPYTTSSGDPVNMVNGNMYHSERDLVIPGRGGFPFVFERYYNSGDTGSGPLGFGWTHSFNHFLRFEDDNFNRTTEAGDTDGLTSAVSWLDGTGARRIFEVAGGAGGVAVGATFSNQPGVFVTVNHDPAGTYSIRGKNGLTYTFENVAGTVGEVARLVTVQDRNGNTLTLSYDATGLDRVTDDLNRALDFTNSGGRITRIQDWTGREWQYQYDGNGNLAAFLNPLAVTGSQPPVTYSYYTAADGVQLDHRMRSYTLPRGNSMTFEYYANGKVFRHYNTLGDTMTFAYNEFRRESTNINERGNTRHYFFDANGNLVRLIEETGAERLYTYDADPARVHNRIAETDPQGLQTQYAYDATGNVVSVTRPSGSTLTYGFFNAFNQPRKLKDPNGNYTVLVYDTRGNLTEEIKLRNGIDPGDPSTYTPNPADLIAWTIHGYDSYGNRVSSKRLRDFPTQIGPVVTTTFDANGLYPTGIERCGDLDGDSQIITPSECTGAPLVYDTLGRVTQGIRGDWETVQYEYDGLNRVIRGTDATGNLRDYSFDENGNPVHQELTLHVSGVPTLVDSSAASFDYADRPDAALDAGGYITQYQYDPAGNIVAITDPDNFTIGFGYDANNRVTSAFDEEGNAVEKVLDATGRLRLLTDPNGNSTTYDYYHASGDGRLQRVTDAVGRSTSYAYDANGNVTRITDNLGRSTDTTYDALNRPVRIVGPQIDLAGTPVRPVHVYLYDTLGNLTGVSAGHTTDLGGNPGSDVLSPQTTDSHDDFGRRLTRTDALGRTWSYQYDVHGNMLQQTDPEGQVVAYTWGYGGQLLTRTASVMPGDPNPHVTGWSRNALGQPTQIIAPEITYDYGYDTAHRLASITDSRGGKALGYDWSPGGLLDSLTDGDGNRTDYLYDPVGRLTGVWAPNGDLIAYEYDAGGRLQEKWLSNGVTTRYNYNPDNTLSLLTNTTDGSSLISQHVYTYDGAGNRDSHTETIGGILTAYSYLYDALNRLTEIRVSGVPAESYTYDALGNRTTRTAGGSTLAYVYDSASQLNAIRLGSPAGADQVTLQYDLNGNLTQKNDLVAGSTLLLAYDALNRLVQASLSGNPVESYQYDPAGNRISRTLGTATTNYLYAGPDIHAEYDAAWTGLALYSHGPGMDDPILRDTGSAVRYYHQDGIGSVVGMSDVAGAVTGTARYDAWGNTVATTGGSIPQYGYTGREPDTTGLIYYRARYYDPEVGRFTQRDPLGFVDGVNRYVYALNNPVNYIDPWGTTSWGSTLNNLWSQMQGYWGPASDYLGQSWDQLIYGNYSDSVTALGTAGQIGTGLLGIDILGDIRDISYDLTNWEWSWSHAGQTALDTIGLIPLIGALKYGDEAAMLARKGNPVIIGENMERVNDYARNVGGETIDDWLAGRQWTQELNEEYISTMKSEGRDIMDIGPDFDRRLRNRIDPSDGRGPSDVYGTERRELQDYGNYEQLYDRTGKYQGGVPGFDY